jgi:hypothetical protein
MHSGFYLWEYLDDIRRHDEELFSIIDIFVTGFEFESCQLVHQPFMINAQELLGYLRRYPVSITSDPSFEKLDPLNDFLVSMWKEWMAKYHPYGIGRSSQSSESLVGEEIIPIILKTDEALYELAYLDYMEQKSYLPTRQHSVLFQQQVLHQKYRSAYVPSRDEQFPAGNVHWTSEEDIYIVKFVESQVAKMDKNAKMLIAWDLLELQIEEDPEPPERMKDANYHWHICRRALALRANQITKTLNYKLPKNSKKNLREIKVSDLVNLRKKP